MVEIDPIRGSNTQPVNLAKASSATTEVKVKVADGEKPTGESLKDQAGKFLEQKTNQKQANQKQTGQKQTDKAPLQTQANTPQQVGDKILQNKGPQHAIQPDQKKPLGQASTQSQNQNPSLTGKSSAQTQPVVKPHNIQPGNLVPDKKNVWPQDKITIGKDLLRINEKSGKNSIESAQSTKKGTINATKLASQSSAVRNNPAQPIPSGQNQGGNQVGFEKPIPTTSMQNLAQPIAKQQIGQQGKHLLPANTQEATNTKQSQIPSQGQQPGKNSLTQPTGKHTASATQSTLQASLPGKHTASATQSTLQASLPGKHTASATQSTLQASLPGKHTASTQSKPQSQQQEQVSTATKNTAVTTKPTISPLPQEPLSEKIVTQSLQMSLHKLEIGIQQVRPHIVFNDSGQLQIIRDFNQAQQIFSKITHLLAKEHPLLLQEFLTNLPDPRHPHFGHQLIKYLRQAGKSHNHDLIGQLLVSRFASELSPERHRQIKAQGDQLKELCSQIFTDKEGDHWRRLFLPLLNDKQINLLRLYMPKQQSSKQKMKGKKARDHGRFLLCFDFEQMGALEMDIYMQDQQLYLIVRSLKMLNVDNMAQIRQLYYTAIMAMGVKGRIAFQYSPLLADVGAYRCDLNYLL